MRAIGALIAFLASLVTVIGFVLGKTTLCAIVPIPGICPSSHAATPIPTPTPDTGGYVPPVSPLRSPTYGSWSGGAKNVNLTVTEVEDMQHIADKKILRFHITVDNGTTTSIQMPVFGSFLAIDSNGQTYKGDPSVSGWPDGFPPGKIAGTVDLQDPVPMDVTTMSINFGPIFGSLEFADGRGVRVDGIAVP